MRTEIVGMWGKIKSLVELRKIPKIKIVFGLVYERRPQPGEKTSATETFVVIDILGNDKEEKNIFSAAKLEKDDKGQPYCYTARSANPWEVGKVNGVMSLNEVIDAWNLGQQIKWEVPCPSDRSKHLRLAAKKGSKLLSTLPPIR
jgi:hypothetical protein